MEYGYARISTREQNEERQLIALREFGRNDGQIILDKQSGKDFDRRGYRRLLRKLKDGDTLVIKSIDRLGRNYEEILEQWHVITKEKGAARVLTVSRHPDPEKGELSYAEAVHSGADIVINTTPAGMYPNVGVCHLDVAAMPGLEAVLDVVYNPDKTELILRAEEAGVPVAVGGLEMLVAQAVYAAEYFLDRKFDDAPAEIRAITAQLRKEQLNVALIGMPSCGKTTIGRALADRLGKRFVDLDEEIVRAAGRSIPDLFAAEGEDGFRAREAEQTARFAREGRQVLSCGGGVVKRPENLRALRQNGVVLFIDRPLDALTVGGGRPLSTSAEALKTMEAQRRPLYLAAADAVIPNETTVADAVATALEALDAIFVH